MALPGRPRPPRRLFRRPTRPGLQPGRPAAQHRLPLPGLRRRELRPSPGRPGLHHAGPGLRSPAGSSSAGHAGSYPYARTYPDACAYPGAYAGRRYRFGVRFVLPTYAVTHAQAGGDRNRDAPANARANSSAHANAGGPGHAGTHAHAGGPAPTRTAPRQRNRYHRPADPRQPYRPLALPGRRRPPCRLFSRRQRQCGPPVRAGTGYGLHLRRLRRCGLRGGKPAGDGLGLHHQPARPYRRRHHRPYRPLDPGGLDGGYRAGA